MMSVLPSFFSLVQITCRRSFHVSSARPGAKPKSKMNLKTPNPPTWMAQVTRPAAEGSYNSNDDKVILVEVKKKVLELLENEGPMSRRRMYDEYLTKMFPTAPFAPNPPPRPLWHRAQYTPDEERVYLTMSKFKKRLIRSLTHDGTVAVMTVNKIRHLIAEMDPPNSDNLDQTLIRKSKMERVCKDESEKTFVWILESWVKVLKQKSLKRAQKEAELLGETGPTRFKAA